MTIRASVGNLCCFVALCSCGSGHDSPFFGALGPSTSNGGADAGTVLVLPGGGGPPGAAGAASGARGASGATGAPCTGAGCGTPQPGGLPAGATCTERNECASGRCEPKTGVRGEECLGACFANGAPCERALDCCSTGCHAGKCGGLCTLEGDDCSKDADCCSNICSGGRCQIDRVNADCRPTGEDCTSGHSRGCCGRCNEETKRCDFGDDTCFAQGVACTTDAQCCHGVCSAGKCTTPCSPDGSACTSSATCCSATCGASGTCVTKQPPDGGTSCIPIQGKCTTSAQCCSGQCFGGFCEASIR